MTKTETRSHKGPGGQTETEHFDGIIAAAKASFERDVRLGLNYLPSGEDPPQWDTMPQKARIAYIRSAAQAAKEAV
jgi:hypothetical protein